METRHKIIITGTGRAGTTFLVRLLSELGQPTGYDGESWKRDYFPHCAAGLEKRIGDYDSPYIVKDPDLCVTLPKVLAQGNVVIDHAIVPVRDLEAAALSRIRVGGTDGDVPGGVIGTERPESQRSVLAERFHRLVETLVANDIPHTFLHFPRFVNDREYAFTKLRMVFPRLEQPAFDAAFQRIADPGLVHTFPSKAVVRSSAAIEFEAASRRRQIWRRTRRVAGYSAALLLAVAVFGFRPVIGTTSHRRHLHLRDQPQLAPTERQASALESEAPGNATHTSPSQPPIEASTTEVATEHPATFVSPAGGPSTAKDSALSQLISAGI